MLDTHGTAAPPTLVRSFALLAVVILCGEVVLHGILAGGAAWWQVALGAGAVGGLGVPLLWVGVVAPTLQARRPRVAPAEAFEARVHRAVELADDEPSLVTVLERALREAAGDHPAELLLADPAGTRLRAVATVGENVVGCGVDAPTGCAAIRRGQTLSFPDNRAMDACPRLAACGPCSATCVPLFALGRTVGVVRTTGALRDTPLPDEVDRLEALALAGGARLGTLRAMETSQTQANFDPLTGLLNRRAAEARLEELRASGTTFALAMGDLDHFKSLNDTHGHGAGDRALRLFAQILRMSLRPGDVAARYGGEEFVVLLPGSTDREAAAVLERVRVGLRNALSRSPEIPAFTTSFGVAGSHQSETVEGLLAVADQALYEAKRAGRDRIVVARLPGEAGPDIPALEECAEEEPWSHVPSC